MTDKSATLPWLLHGTVYVPCHRNLRTVHLETQNFRIRIYPGTEYVRAETRRVGYLCFYSWSLNMKVPIIINHQIKSKKVKRKIESNITKKFPKDVWFSPWIADKELWPSLFGAHFQWWPSPPEASALPLPPKKKRTFPTFNNLVGAKKVFNSFWKHSV